MGGREQAEIYFVNTDEECIDVIEMIKDCRDTVREQQDAHKLASEVSCA